MLFSSMYALNKKVDIPSAKTLVLTRKHTQKHIGNRSYKSKAFFVVISAFSCSAVIFFGSDNAAVSSIFCSGLSVFGKMMSK